MLESNPRKSTMLVGRLAEARFADLRLPGLAEAAGLRGGVPRPGGAAG